MVVMVSENNMASPSWDGTFQVREGEAGLDALAAKEETLEWP